MTATLSHDGSESVSASRPSGPEGDCPRVLFVTSHAFNHLTGGGVTFSNLFQGWPRDRLATIHNDVVPTSDDVCDRYYVLGHRELDLAPPLDRLRDRVRGGRSGLLSGAGVPPDGDQQTAARQSGTIKRIALGLMGSALPQHARLSSELAAWIEAYRPDVLFTILGSNAMMDLIERIRLRFGLPMVVHMMDDWPSARPEPGVFGVSEWMKKRRRVARHLKAATTCLGISDAMCAAYEKRYGRSFLSVQNAVDIQRWRTKARRNAGTGTTPYKLLYVGSVYAFAQFQSLMDLARTVGKMSDSGFPVEFEISSPAFLVAPYRQDLEVHESVRISEPMERDDVFYDRIARADALVLPVNFDQRSVTFIRYSMPTKVPAYLSSGTPILVHGPRGVAQVDYAAYSGWGLVVSERNDDKLAEALRTILTDMSLREYLQSRAQAVARDWHDAETVRSRFQQALIDAAGRTAPQTAAPSFITERN